MFLISFMLHTCSALEMKMKFDPEGAVGVTD